ncbi:Na+/Pi symporter [Elasticomyces elasticus]|uniref:Na+/Pi symporter n=1 Tax=Elasticomyces elasticus TaxID=574655 RepID=A0AAN7W3I6_9PEZI|nr:Na+/Pi symporter [Elasticomyces elasticus]
MLGIACALVASSTYLTFATKIGLPVSTTHCIVDGVIGVGIASLGADGVNWGWKGVSQVFAAWVIAPGVAGIFGAIVSTISKYTILKRKNPLKFGLIMMPIFFAFTAGVLVMVIILGCIFGMAGAVAVIVITFLILYLYRKLILDDWQLKLWHLPLGPLLLRRGPVPERPTPRRTKTPAAKGADTDAEALPWYKDPKNRLTGGAFKLAKNTFFHGVNVDVAAEQNKKFILAGDLEKMHAHAQHFDNKAEHLFSYLQVMTAATASFAHGANDVPNAIGPLATIFLVWNTGTISTGSHLGAVLRWCRHRDRSLDIRL